MKNKEIVKEIKGMQAKMDVLISKIEKNEKPVAGWYKGDLYCGSKLFYYDGLDALYGWLHGKVWFDTKRGYNIEPKVFNERFKPASPKEVETRLIQEAEKRGFKEGVMVDPIPNPHSEVIGKRRLDNGLHYKESVCSNYIHTDCGNTVVFRDGKWAEIIEEPKLTLGCHEVTVSENGNIIYFNGGFIYVDTARKIVESNIDSFLLSGQLEKTCIQVDELQELLTKIDER